MAMNTPKQRAAKQVLAEAAKVPHLAGRTDGERLVWMLERAFELGAESAGLLTSKKCLESDQHGCREAGGN